VFPPPPTQSLSMTVPRKNELAYRRARDRMEHWWGPSNLRETDGPGVGDVTISVIDRQRAPMGQ